MGFIRRSATNPLALAAFAGTVLLLIAAACGGASREQQVTGLVLEAVERSLTEIESLRLRDAEGRVWEFSTRGPVGTSAAHLRQHQVSGERVTVTYVEQGGRLLALDVADVSAPGG